MRWRVLTATASGHACGRVSGRSGDCCKRFPDDGELRKGSAGAVRIPNLGLARRRSGSPIHCLSHSAGCHRATDSSASRAVTARSRRDAGNARGARRPRRGLRPPSGTRLVHRHRPARPGGYGFRALFAKRPSPFAQVDPSCRHAGSRLWGGSCAVIRGRSHRPCITDEAHALGATERRPSCGLSPSRSPQGVPGGVSIPIWRGAASALPALRPPPSPLSKAPTVQARHAAPLGPHRFS